MTTSGGYLESVVQAIDELHEELVETSLDIHAHPELNYEAVSYTHLTLPTNREV